MTRTIETVQGPLAVDQLGKTMIHEHFSFGYPGFQDDVTSGGFNHEEALQVGRDVATRLQAHGVKTVVDPTPIECGRDPELLREISEQTGMQIICATGYYYERENAPVYSKFSSVSGDAEAEIYEMFMKEIQSGIGETGIKPGIIKLASSENVITDYEKNFFKAAAKVQKQTGITILTHTQEGTMGPEQAKLLLSEGADPSRIVIGHMCGNADVRYHLSTLETGVHIAFDRFGIQGMAGRPTDEARKAVLLGLIGLGYEEQLFMSHDTVNYWLGRPLTVPESVQEMMTDWQPTHIFEKIIPAMKQAGVTKEQIDQLFIGNPKAVFGG